MNSDKSSGGGAPATPVQPPEQSGPQNKLPAPSSHESSAGGVAPGPDASPEPPQEPAPPTAEEPPQGPEPPPEAPSLPDGGPPTAPVSLETDGLTIAVGEALVDFAPEPGDATEPPETIPIEREE